jgi:putative phage-type endonuclease
MDEKREIKHEIIPRDEAHWHELRSKVLTSTDIAALFGASPYLTEFELFHRKRSQSIVINEPTELMKWGTRLQNAIAQGACEDMGVEGRPMKEFIFLPRERIGASFDWAIDPDELLEVKNVFGPAFKDRWLINDDGTIEAPEWIELQIQVQLFVSGRKRAHISALVNGNQLVITPREPQQDVINEIRERVANFWKRVEANDPPAPDFQRDCDFISRLYRVEPGKVIEADCGLRALASLYESARLRKKEAEDDMSAIKANILTKIGGAEKVLDEEFTLSAGMVKGGERHFTVEPYRGFRINWKKGG